MGELVPFKPGFLTEPITSLENIRLKGVKCQKCGALTLGSDREHCINCTSTDLTEHIFTTRGKVDTFTIYRAAPPPPYPHREGYQPTPVAWVLLDDGLILMSELTGVSVDEVKTGMPVELDCQVGWTEANGNDVVMYKFRAIK